MMRVMRTVMARNAGSLRPGARTAINCGVNTSATAIISRSKVPKTVMTSEKTRQPSSIRSSAR